MDDGSPNGLFTGIICRRNTRIVQERQQLLPMEPKSILQSYLVRIGQLITEQPIETVSDLRDTTVKTVQRQIRRWADHPIIQVNGFTEQFPDLGCPGRFRQPLKDSFQIPELMLETDLKVPGRCFDLRAYLFNCFLFLINIC